MSKDKQLKKLETRKAAGPDDISLMLLKEAADGIAAAITLLFQASIDQGSTPSTWRKALVVPIFKKGSNSDARIYRPIFLTSVVCIHCEHNLHSTILTHLACLKIPSDAQHGFRGRRSCDTQLLLALNDFARGLEDRCQTDKIFLNFAKAFDKVSHQQLLRVTELMHARSNGTNHLHYLPTSITVGNTKTHLKHCEVFGPYIR